MTPPRRIRRHHVTPLFRRAPKHRRRVAAHSLAPESPRMWAGAPHLASTGGERVQVGWVVLQLRDRGHYTP